MESACQMEGEAEKQVSGVKQAVGAEKRVARLCESDSIVAVARR